MAKNSKSTGLPRGFDEIRGAIVKSGVNTRTDMSLTAMRADAATLRRAIEAVVGDVAVPPRNRGRFTGFRTYDFQNTLFFANDRPGWGFTDRTLALVWAVELASNRCDFLVHADYVGSTRTAYVHGRHGTNVVEPSVTASAVHTLAAPKKARAKKVAAAVEVPAEAIDTTEEVPAITE